MPAWYESVNAPTVGGTGGNYFPISAPTRTGEVTTSAGGASVTWSWLSSPFAAIAPSVARSPRWTWATTSTHFPNETTSLTTCYRCVTSAILLKLRQRGPRRENLFQRPRGGGREPTGGALVQIDFNTLGKGILFARNYAQPWHQSQAKR